MPRNYLAESAARLAPRFAETRRLLSTWTDAFRLNLAQPSDENRAAAKQAHAAYKQEQERTLSQSPTTTSPE